MTSAASHPGLDDRALGVSELTSIVDALEEGRSTEVIVRLERARLVEEMAIEEGDERLVMRTRLVIADMLQRTGDVETGYRLAMAVRQWAEANVVAPVEARSHLVLSSVFAAIGDAAQALDHAVRANDLLDESATTRQRGNHRLCLADALAAMGAIDDARRHYHETLQLFTVIGDHERRLAVLNNMVVLECEAGHADDAAAASERLAQLAGTLEAMDASLAETIARARLLSGDIAGAADAITIGLRLLAEQGEGQLAAPAELLLAEAEVSLALGRLDQCEASLRRCATVSEQRHLSRMAVEVGRVRAEWFAAQGRHREAYETHCAYHRGLAALHGAEQEAIARTRHALYEAANARREADHFRRQARTDPLTELWNRRHVDETLPPMLADHGLTDGGGVMVAIVDVDHFKAINDSFSHETGDRVLQRLADLLRQVAPAESHLGFVARLGGEEFLVVRTDLTGDRFRRSVERLRRNVESHDWSDLDVGLRVTISAGIASARPGDDQPTILRRADELLYAAKVAGRNRVLSAR